MNSHLKDYLMIYKQFPLNGYYSKNERKLRHTMITNWENKDLEELPTIAELINFVKQYKEEILITPQFFKKFKTAWQDDLKNGYLFAEFLLEMDLEEIIWKLDISTMFLAEQVLKHNPHHKKALTLKLKTLIYYHDFCLHELPWVVLVEENLEEELKSIEIMENIVKELNFKNENLEILISNCKTYYPLWFEYLKEKEKFQKGFEEFLIEKGIDTEQINVPYTMI